MPLYTIGTAQTQSTGDTKCWEDVEQREFSFIMLGMQSGTVTLEEV